MINLIIVRHGDSEPQIQGKDDKERKLTKKGVKEMKRVANFIDKLEINIDKIVSSPYLRAYQSAKEIIDELGIDENKIEIYEELSPDKDPSQFLEKLKNFPDNVAVLVVGHNPYLSNLIKALTGANVDLEKGGIALIDYDLSKNKGVLRVLLNQKVLKMI